MTKKEKALKLTKEARELAQQIGRSSMAIGKIAATMQDEGLVELAGYANMEEWFQEVADFGESWGYELMRLYRRLRENKVPEKVIEKIPVNNAKVFSKLPESKQQNAEVQAAAQELNSTKFQTYVDRTCPDLHIEPSKKFVTFAFSKENLAVVDAAIARAREIGGAEMGKSEAIAYICSVWSAQEEGAQATAPEVGKAAPVLIRRVQ